jgi:hypothetical protein
MAHRHEDMSMKLLGKLVAFCVFAFAVASPVHAAMDCKRVEGEALLTLIPSNDPLGRVMGPATGRLKATATSSLLSLAPNPDGSLAATRDDVWVVGAQNVIRFAGTTVWTPTANAPIGTVAERTTLTVVSGTGAYAGATGTIEIVGIGVNVFGSAAGPGSTYFDVDYTGTICRAN